MGPLRLLVLAVLLYIGYRLIVSSFRKNSDQKKMDGQSADGDGKITDVLVEDPVCHKLVPKQQAQTLQDNDETLYFCSEECRDKYVSEKGEDI